MGISYRDLVEWWGEDEVKERFDYEGFLKGQRSRKTYACRYLPIKHPSGSPVGEIFTQIDLCEKELVIHDWLRRSFRNPFVY